jgi:hypothetical protein
MINVGATVPGRPPAGGLSHSRTVNSEPAKARDFFTVHIIFAVDFAVPFDNNLSGCFRGLYGARTFASLMSIIKTAINQDIPPHIAVRSVFSDCCCVT